MSGLAANFVTQDSNMNACLPGELIFGMQGAPGGYYIITATQPDESTLRLTFTPSKNTMDSIDPVDITLPEGPKGEPGQADADQVQALVEEYLAENPPQVTETDPTVPDWAKAKNKPSYTAQEVGALSQDDLQSGIDQALAQAKASGEFDGPQGETGPQGPAGADGITPEFSIGTVETLAAGSNATASISGTAENPVLNLGIPKGEDGSNGSGSETWELINTITVSDDETTSVIFTTDNNGDAFALKKILVKVTAIKGAATYMSLRINGATFLQQFVSAGTGTSNYTEANPITIEFQILGDGIYECNTIPLNRQVRVDGDTTPNGSTQSHIENMTQIQVLWGTGAALTNGAIFTLYGVRA